MVDRCPGGSQCVRRPLAQEAVLAVLVVVGDEIGQYLLEVGPAEDEETVQALSADAAHKALGDRVRTRARTGVLMTLMPSVKKTSWKPAVNFAPLSRTRNLAARGRSERSKFRFRACWVTQSRTGWASLCHRRRVSGRTSK